MSKPAETQLKKDFINTLLTVFEDIKEIKECINKTQDSILTEKQVLDMLGIGAKTLRSYRTNGLLAYSKIGNRFFYRMSDIDKMMDNARVESDYS